jgi:tRNA dimethylallyltransferase
VGSEPVLPVLPPIACLIGPTASGKSSLALQWALEHQAKTGQTVEIVSMDSALVYRGLDIGSAKPTPQEQSQVRHHLIDLCEPEDHYSVAQCHADTQACIEHIRSRSHLPLIVGGTMLYFKALWQGLDDLPSTPQAVRDTIAQEAAQKGWPALHEELRALDPATANRLAPSDAQRISRALEVVRHTGRSLSDWIVQSQTQGSGLPALPLQVIALLPSNRQWLHDRIAVRFTEMVKQGFLEEVKGLMARPGLTPEHPSMRSVGYRQAWAHLTGESVYEDFLRKGIEATRQLAKRQITWLRGFEQTAASNPSEGAKPSEGTYQSVDPCRLDHDQLMTVCSASFGRA